ncbi:MAG: lipopolysaccharide biosynthesis protein [Henriciella sp.]|nr:lipopolysaccharide biosynthesis protein [Henriciella sp.]
MKLLSHLAGYLPVNIANGIAAFGGVYVFTRLLGPEEYGRYALMFSVMALIHTLSLTPAEASAYRFAGKAEADNRLPDHFRTALSLTLRSLALTALLIVALALALGKLPEYLKILPWIAILMPINTVIQMALEAHKATQQVGRFALVETTRLLGGFIFGALIAWQSGFGAACPFIGMVIAGVILVAPEARWLSQQAKGGATSVSHRKEYLAYGIPIAAALVLDLILSAADRFLLALFMGEAAVGEYAAGYGVADKTVLLLCAWAAMAGSPLIMAAYERGGKDAARDEARGLIRTLLLIGIPAATGLALVAQPLAEALIGENVRAGAMQIIPWIAFAGLLNGLLIYYFSEAFQLAHKTKERALLMLVPASANIILNLILIPQMGLMGAVIATVASYALGITVLASFGRRFVALPLPFGELVKVAFAALAMWPVLILVPAWGGWAELITKAFIGGAAYIIAALLLDAGGARGFVREKLASKGRTAA